MKAQVGEALAMAPSNIGFRCGMLSDFLLQEALLLERSFEPIPAKTQSVSCKGTRLSR